MSKLTESAIGDFAIRLLERVSGHCVFSVTGSITASLI